MICTAKIKKTSLIVILLMFISIFTFTYKINQESIWYDEFGTIEVLSQPDINAVFHQIAVEENNPPVYYLLLRAWSGFGKVINPVYLRFFSVLIAIIGIWMIYSIGSALFDRKTGCIASILFATSPYILWYAQETRNLMLEAVSAMAILFFFFKFCESGKKRYFFAAALFQLIGIFTHYYLFFLMPAQIIYLCIVRDRRKLVIWSTALFIICVLFVPWLPFMQEQLAVNNTAWLRKLNINFPIVLLNNFSVGIFQFSHRKLIFFSMVLFFLLFVLGIVTGFRESKRCNSSKNILLVLLFFFVPLILSVLVSLFKPILYEGRRYLILILPIFFILAANGIVFLKKNDYKSLLIILLVSLNCYYMINLYTAYQKRFWNRAANAIKEQSLPGDGYFSLDYTKGKILEFYGTGNANRLEMPSNHIVKNALADYDRVWLITTEQPAHIIAKQFMDEQYRLIQETSFCNDLKARVNLYLYAPNDF